MEGGGGGQHGEAGLEDGVGGAGEGGGGGGGLQTEAAGVRVRVGGVSCLIEGVRDIRDYIRSPVLEHPAGAAHRHLPAFHRRALALHYSSPRYQGEDQDYQDHRDDEDPEDPRGEEDEVLQLEVQDPAPLNSPLHVERVVGLHHPRRVLRPAVEGPVPDGAGGGDGQDGPDHAAVNDLLLH